MEAASAAMARPRRTPGGVTGVLRRSMRAHGDRVVGREGKPVTRHTVQGRGVQRELVPRRARTCWRATHSAQVATLFSTGGAPRSVSAGVKGV